MLARFLLLLSVVTLAHGCWRPNNEMLADINLYPYPRESLCVLKDDFFIFETKVKPGKTTVRGLLKGAGVVAGGKQLPSSIDEWKESTPKREDILDGLEEGTELNFLHVAFVTDWYSNTDIYYGVFESVGGAERYIIRLGPLVSGSTFKPYSSIVVQED